MPNVLAAVQINQLFALARRPRHLKAMDFTPKPEQDVTEEPGVHLCVPRLFRNDAPVSIYRYKRHAKVQKQKCSKCTLLPFAISHPVQANQMQKGALFVRVRRH